MVRAGLASLFGLKGVMTRVASISGALCISMGVAWLLPVFFELSYGEGLSALAKTVVWLGPVLIGGGLLLMVWSARRPREASVPAPVRMAITGNVLFLAFCALEFSDGLVRQGGRVFYWTSVLFVPALLLLAGLTLAHRWAWWLARGVTMSFTLGFIVLAVVIPFSDVRSEGVPVPPWGRVWMITVTLAFVCAAFFAFRALGHVQSRFYFRVSHQPEPSAVSHV